MSENDALDLRLQCDVTKTIPLDAGTVDLFMAHSGIEHFANNEAFLQNCFRALRPGGYIPPNFPVGTRLLRLQTECYQSAFQKLCSIHLCQVTIIF